MGDEKTITIKKQDLWKYSTFVLIAVVVIGIIVFSGGPKSGSSNSGSSVTDTGATEQQGVNVRALIEDNDPVHGDKNAEISIIEFSDFQCPFCARAHFGALADFRKSSYFTNGEVNLVYKHFPLNSIHPQAQKSAEASLCAHEQDVFWEYHDTLFENQEDWSSRGTSAMKEYAQQLGLDTGDFNNCLDGGKWASEVNKELAQATASGGRGTPFFVIVNTETGQATSISGAYPWSEFEAAIQSVQ